MRGAVARALDRSVAVNDAASCRVMDGDFAGAIDDLKSSSLELEEFTPDGASKDESAGAGSEGASSEDK